MNIINLTHVYILGGDVPAKLLPSLDGKWDLRKKHYPYELEQWSVVFEFTEGSETFFILVTVLYRVRPEYERFDFESQETFVDFRKLNSSQMDRFFEAHCFRNLTDESEECISGGAHESWNYGFIEEFYPDRRHRKVRPFDFDRLRTGHSIKTFSGKELLSINKAGIVVMELNVSSQYFHPPHNKKHSLQSWLKPISCNPTHTKYHKKGNSQLKINNFPLPSYKNVWFEG